MAYTMTSDISRMIVAGQKEIYTDNYDAYPVEYADIVTFKDGVQKTETFDSMGSLPGVQEKQEGGAIQYGKVSQAYQTSVTSKTWSDGFEVTLEAVKFDRYGVINSAKAKELANRMREGEEERAALRFDNAFTTALADGQALFTNSRPCFNAPGVTNDTLTTGPLTPANVKTAVQMFANFKNHLGKPKKADPTDLITHKYNMLTVEEILKSTQIAYEQSNTKNVLPGLKPVYNSYIASQTAWAVRDRKIDHILFVWWMKTEFGNDEDKINTKNLYLNAIAMYETGVLPNIGIVGSAGT